MDSNEIEIPIKYHGLDADRHEIEIVSLGQSLQGAGKLIKAAGSVVIPRRGAARLRVVVRSATPSCYDIVALLILMQPILPVLTPAAQKAIEAIVNYTLARFANKPDAAERMADLAKISMQEMGMTARASLEATIKVSENNRASAKQFIAPVGDTCLTAMIGHEINGVVLFNQADRQAIEFEEVEIGEEATFAVLITELDIKNMTCKFNIRGESEDKRYIGNITDPSLIVPNNAYSLALAQKQWIEVRAKPEIMEGEIARLYISNTA